MLWNVNVSFRCAANHFNQGCVWRHQLPASPFTILYNKYVCMRLLLYLFCCFQLTCGWLWCHTRTHQYTHSPTCIFIHHFHTYKFTYCMCNKKKTITITTTVKCNSSATRHLKYCLANSNGCHTRACVCVCVYIWRCCTEPKNYANPIAALCPYTCKNSSTNDCVLR